MSKGKRNKSATGSTHTGTHRWDVAISSTPFIEEGIWSACTALVVGSKREDFLHVSALTDAVNTGSRKLFKVITQQSLFDEVNDLGNPKNKKPKEIPLNVEVCEACKPFLDAGEDIPLPLLAKLIKYKLLDLKQKDVNRRDGEKKQSDDISGRTSKASEKTPRKGDKKDGSKSAKGKAEKKAPDVAKMGSKLRKRGEEDQALTFLDDEPQDGADHYFIISGFHSPHLVSHLAEIGVFIDCVIKMTSEEYPVPELTSEIPLSEEPPPKDEKEIALEEEQAKAEQKERAELSLFWRDAFLLLKASSVLKLHDIPCLDYVIKQAIVPTNPDDFEQRSEYHELLFDDISALMYHLLESKRQWKNYLKNLQLHHVPVPNEQGTSMRDVHSQPSASPVAGMAATRTGAALGVSGSEGLDSARVPETDEPDMRLYTQLINCVPAESTSVFLVMHCMLEQVEASEECHDLSDHDAKLPRPDGLEDGLATYITEMAMKLGLSDKEQELIASDFDLPPNSPPASTAPLLVGHRDEVALRLRHLKAIDNFDMQAAELAMRKRLASAYEIPVAETENAVAVRERAARTHEMISFLCSTGLSESQVDHAFRQFIFESMKLTTVEDGVVQTQHKDHVQNHLPWDDPYPYYMHMIKAEPPKDEWEMDENMESMITSIRSAAEDRCSPSWDREERLSNAVVSIDGSVRSHSAHSSKLGDESARSPANPLHSQTKGLVERSPGSASMRRASFGAPAERQNNISSASTFSAAQRRPSHRGSRRSSSAQSVHFETDELGHPIPQPGDEEDVARIVTPGINDNEEEEEEEEKEAVEVRIAISSEEKEINNPQARVLDEWCFSENLPPHILQQVLTEASYELPYMDSYFNKHDNTLMLVLHNPFDKGIKNQTTWQARLHSDVNFRNYLEYVAQLIVDWTIEEEAKYNAQQLSKEVEKMTEMTAPEPVAVAPKSRQSTAKSRKKDRSKSPAPKAEKPVSRTGSLKALKEQKDREKAEDDEKETKDKRKKSGKRLGSAKDKSLSPSSSRNKLNDEYSPTPALTLVNEPLPPYWPFSGYDLGDNIVHASGSTTVLFPTDGGQIRVEKVDFVEGQRSVRVVVLKDGHIFTVNVLDPKDLSVQDEPPLELAPAAVEAAEKSEETEKADSEKSEKEERTMITATALTPTVTNENAEVKSTAESGVTFSESVHDITIAAQDEENGPTGSTGLTPPPGMPAAISAFSSFTAQFKDGMCLAFSAYGDSGEPVDGKPHVPLPYKMPQMPRSATPSVKDAVKFDSPTKMRKGKDRMATPDTTGLAEEVTDIESEAATEKIDAVPYQPFQQMFVTCSDGLTVSYFLETAYGIKPEQEDERRLLVKQTYAVKTAGQQRCEAARAKAMLEVSRLTTTDGTVVKTMQDGTTEVLYGDGTVAHLLLHSPLLPESRVSTPPVRVGAESPRSGRESKKGKKRTGSKRGDVPTEFVGDESQQMSKWHWLITTPSGERFAMRKNGRHLTKAKPARISVSTDPQTKQIMSSREDNVVTIKYPDGSTLVEHADGTRITTYYKEIHVYADDAAENELAEMELTRWKCVQIECPGFATVHFSDGHCDTVFAGDTYVRTYLEGRHVVNHSTGSRLTMSREGVALYEPADVVKNEGTTGYFFNHASATICSMMDTDGNTFTVQNDGECQAVRGTTEEEDVGKQHTEGYGRHAPRLFVVNRDGSGTELLRYADIAEFMAAAEDDITTAMIADPLANQEGVVGMTTLRPLVSDVSQNLLRPYAAASLTPPGLAHRDLRGLPPNVVVVPGPPFGTKAGRGLAIGSCADRKPPHVVPPCPDVLQLRQILQHKPISEELRQQMSNQLRRYADFVSSRQIEADSFLLQEPRSEGECILAAEMAAPYSTADLDDEVEITQQSSGVTAQTSLLQGDVRALYLQATAPPEPSPPPTPMPKRTNSDWERDARELADALDARLALRHNLVPKYFESQLGKAFLLSQAMDLGSLSRELAEETRLGEGKHFSASFSTKTLPVVASDSELEAQAMNSITEQALVGSEAVEGVDDEEVPTNADQEAGSASLPEENDSPPEERDVVDITSLGTGASLHMSNGMRPQNPTPGHAIGQSSPANVRPLNPTPAHATILHDRPDAPTPKESVPYAVPVETYPSIPEQPLEEQEPSEETEADDVEKCAVDMEPEVQKSVECDQKIMTKTLRENVIGEPRSDPVKLPAYFGSGRPGALPNIQFAQVEAATRRQTCTTSTVGTIGKGAAPLLNMVRRGFQLLPMRVDFGHLREGATYAFTVHMKNVGIDTCRFRLRQPPPCTGLRVIYKPGPVAAGMKTELTLEIYAIAVGVEGQTGIGSISHNIEIITEVEYLFLPVTATILTVSQWDDEEMERGCQIKPSAGVKLVSYKPPGSQGIIRPRKDSSQPQVLEVN